MVDVANKPMMEHVVNLLKKHKITDITALLYYQPKIITDYFKDGKDFNCRISYIKTGANLGTAGAVGTTRKAMKDTFLVMSGDVICDFDLQKAIKFHKQKKALATILLTSVPDPLQYGIVITDKGGRIKSFLEKPTWGEVFSDKINTGTYILEPEIFKYIPENEEMDFSKNLFPLLLEKKERLFGYVADGYWKDVGNLDEYLNCHIDILEGKVNLKLDYRKIEINGFPVWLGKNTKIPKETKFEGPAIFGNNVEVQPYTTITSSVFGDGAKIGKYSKIVNSVVQKNVSISHHCDIKEAVAGFNTKIANHVKIFPGVVIGNDCNISFHVTCKAKIKVWPQKEIESGAFVNSSVIWAEKFSRTLFTTHGINGLVNIEITPEFATRLGAAIGSKTGKGSYVITSRDANQASRMIKRSIIAGLISMGVRVGDLRTTAIPVVKYEMGKEGEALGIHVRISPFDARVVDILMFDETGCEISPKQQKAIEQAFFKEDFGRATTEEVGEIIIPPRSTEYYREGFLKNLKQEIFKDKKSKIVIDYAFSPSSMIFPSILGNLDIETISLNGVLNPKTSKTPEGFENSLNTLSKIVKSTRSFFGVMLDAGGEKIFLIDEKGKRIHSHKAMLVVLWLVGKLNPGKKIVLPVTAGIQAENIAKKFNLKIIYAGTSPQRITEKCKEKDVIFGADGKGGFIFPKFHPSFDGMFAICKILEMLSSLDVRLGEVAGKIKEPAILRNSVFCPWEKKGFVMRCLIEKLPSKKTLLIDGVKLCEKNHWVLFIPDANRARFNLYCEAVDKKTSRKILNQNLKYLKKLIKT